MTAVLLALNPKPSRRRLSSAGCARTGPAQAAAPNPAVKVLRSRRIIPLLFQTYFRADRAILDWSRSIQAQRENAINELPVKLALHAGPSRLHRIPGEGA